MKKRLAKKIEKMRRKKIHEALEMVLEINTTHASLRRSLRLMDTLMVAWIFVYIQMGGTLVAINIWTFSTNYIGCSTDRLLEELANKKKEIKHYARKKRN